MAKTLPVMLLKNLVLLPNQEVKLELSNPLSLNILELSEKNFQKQFVLVSPKDFLEEIPDVEDLPSTAVIAQISKKILLPNNHVRVTIVGGKRVKISKYFNPEKEKEILHCSYFIIITVFAYIFSFNESK